MEMNKLICKPETNICFDLLPEEVDTENTYKTIFTFDARRFHKFVVQLLNTGSNVLSYKIETTFNNTNWSLIKSETDIAGSNIDLVEDEVTGSIVRVSVKSKVEDTHTKCLLYLRLCPFASVI